MATGSEKLAVELCGLRLAGPVLNASGTFDLIAACHTFGQAALSEFPFDAYVSKTITAAARHGNPPPRLWETPSGLINSIGLPNAGADAFLGRDLEVLCELSVPVIVSVMGFSREEFAGLCAAVGERDEVAAIELNVSCPNVKTGVFVGADPHETKQTVQQVRSSTWKPVIVKLAPNASDPGDVAQAAEDAGADAISLINTLRGMAVDTHTRRPVLGGTSGGLSGPAVRAVALEQVHTVARRVSVPVIGMGGIATGADALEFLAAGARCVAVGTETFNDPAAGTRIRRELRELVEAAPVQPQHA